MHYESIPTDIGTVTWVQMAVDFNQRSSWTCPVLKFGYVPLGGHCGEMLPHEDRVLTNNPPMQLSRQTITIHEEERIPYNVCSNWIRRYDMAWHWELTHVCGLMLAMGPENLPVVWVWTGTLVRLGFRIVQKTDPLRPAGVDIRTSHKHTVFWTSLVPTWTQNRTAKFQWLRTPVWIHEIWESVGKTKS